MRSQDRTPCIKIRICTHKYHNRTELENALTRVTAYGMRTGPVQCARGSRGRGTAASARRWRGGGFGGRRRLLYRDGDVVGTRSRWHPFTSTHQTALPGSATSQLSSPRPGPPTASADRHQASPQHDQSGEHRQLQSGRRPLCVRPIRLAIPH